ncbi:UDP-4-amino-4,6-dideoxy-N-acetyl-beta-L-altrosamine N-acetyltransferase [Sulfurospirillum sp. 1307]
MIKLKNFIDLTQEEISLVLNWRNHPNIQKWMHTKDISIKEHLNFIKSLQTSKSKNYFLVLENTSYLGVIYLVNNYIGLYANPEKKGVGKILMNEIINFASKVKKLKFIKAEVYKENQKAIQLYKKFGFTNVDESEQLLIMQLDINIF